MSTPDRSDIIASRADVPIRDAATVVLLRDGAEGLEVWLLTRVTQMAFAAGMSVFPGGRVDDADADLPMDAGTATELAVRFETDERSARALVGAAVREVFEETGVLLSNPRADLSAARTDVEAGRVSFGELLRANDLSIDAAALRPWARWVTPPGEKRRYDTRFFVGALPAGAVAEDVTTESSEAAWVPVAEALAQAERGERMLLPPTLVTLGGLTKFATVSDVLAAAEHQALDPVQPKLRIEENRVLVELPGGTLVEVPRTMFA